MRPWLLPTLCCCAAYVACSGDPPLETPDAGAADLGPSDTGGVGDSGALDAQVVEDSGAGDTGQGPDSGVLPPNRCDDWGLPKRSFEELQVGLQFGDRAGDFTVTTTTGATWNLKQEWVGCESYVFLVYFSGANGNALFRSSLDPLVLSPLPAHYFFASSEADRDGRLMRLGALGERLAAAIERRTRTPEEAAAQWRRFHLVADRAQEIPGSVGAMVTDYLNFASSSVVDLGDGRRAAAPAPVVFGIDREQRWDPGDNLAEYVGGPVSFRMASFLPRYYGYRVDLADRLARETDAQVIPLLEESETTARIFTRTATLPAAVDLANFDHLEFDVRINCAARNPFACSEWDRIARIAVCLDAGCADRRELARWITPYWRRGQQHWTIDASALLPLLDPGGPRRFFIETGPDWERATTYDVQIDLRLRQTGAGRRAKGAVLAFRGGAFEANYPVVDTATIGVPATASRISVVSILSGHGQVAGSNCAEWCDHRHQFEVDGATLPEIQPSTTVGSGLGCGERVDQGVLPGQWGNWAPERAYWCPGLPLTPIEQDAGPPARPGQTAVIRYRASWDGAAPPGGDIDLSTYLVWYE